MKKLAFIGGGNMAEALARGLIAGKVFQPADLIVADVDPARRRKLGRALQIETTADNLAAVRAARAILFAVKPQNIDDVLGEIRAAIALGGKPPMRARPAGAPVPIAARARLFISIAAGVTIARLSAALGAGARVIRVMPNAPAMVGQGMAALTRSPGASRADLSFALRIFRAVGDAIALDNEALLDAVTALSGSGPAYVYLFVKALADGGVAEGLEPEMATRMALQTLRGAVETMSKSKLNVAELIRIVASPGGTTEAALRKFDERGFSAIVGDALHAAAQRSRELGRG
jgi:pyrroline-5-carboxylate reductase